MKLLLLFLYFTGCCFAARKTGIDDCDLCDYVYHDDGHFEVTVLDSAVIVNAVTTYKLNMTSQKWNDESFSSQPVWYHTIVVHVPDQVDHSTALLSYFGLRNTIDIDIRASVDRMQINFLAELAADTNTVTAIVFNIPNEEIVFNTPKGALSFDSDEALGYTVAAFMQLPLATVSLITPMVKAGVKAMDAVQQFTQERGVTVNQFVLHGISKRAWPVWLGAAIDYRVKAIIPVTGNFLNFGQMISHVYRSMNASFPFFNAPWKFTGALGSFGHPNQPKYLKVTDPYEYREYIRVPKYLIVAGQDDTFPADNTFLFYKKLRGEKRLYIVENTGHFLDYHPSTFSDILAATKVYYTAVIGNVPRPKMKWRIKVLKSGKGKIAVMTEEEPTYVAAFVADSVVPNRRDFRRFVFCPTCSPIQFCPGCTQTPLKDMGDIWREDSAVIQSKTTVKGKFKYIARYAPAVTGYRQFYIKVKFAGGFVFTSESLVLPNAFPTDSVCVMDQCTAAPLV